jgi:hypothetical protein
LERGEEEEVRRIDKEAEELSIAEPLERKNIRKSVRPIKNPSSE